MSDPFFWNANRGEAGATISASANSSSASASADFDDAPVGADVSDQKPKFSPVLRDKILWMHKEMAAVSASGDRSRKEHLRRMFVTTSIEVQVAERNAKIKKAAKLGGLAIVIGAIAKIGGLW